MSNRINCFAATGQIHLPNISLVIPAPVPKASKLRVYTYVHVYTRYNTDIHSPYMHISATHIRSLCTNFS